MRKRAVLLLVAMAAALAVGSGVAYAASIGCDEAGDRDPDFGQCRGTPDGDGIRGKSYRDVIRALAGNDRVFAFDGRDTIYGGKGNDKIDGSGANDTIYGGPDGDGGPAGLPFADFNDLHPNTSTPNLQGGFHSDTVYGEGGPDNIDAAEDDAEPGVPGTFDRSFGGGGNDRILAVDGNQDLVHCGGGTADVARIDQGIDSAKNCEKVRRV
jgi:large repetitive protein